MENVSGGAGRFYFRKMAGKAKANSGSMTVEAALVLPVALCIVLSVVFFIKTVYTHELVQHAITETAEELASAGYILHISGLGELNTGLESGMESRAQIFRNHIDTVFESFDSLGGLFETREAVDTIAANPVDELKNAACLLAGGVYDDLKTQLFTPLVKMYLKKYLASGSSREVDQKLRALNIRNGFEGLDFSGSTFLTDEKNEIDIVVKYRINLPVPIKIVPEVEIVQRAAARAWMGGDDPSGVIEEGDGEDLWALDNFTRGRKIQSIFGANLPFNFPLIAKFENGKATMIKSMDLTAKSYKDSFTVTKTLDEYLSALHAFKGQEEPWGSSKTVIRAQEIKAKELLLVIPKNQLDPATEQLLVAFADKASSMGIQPVIERYGLKKIE